MKVINDDDYIILVFGQCKNLDCVFSKAAILDYDYCKGKCPKCGSDLVDKNGLRIPKR